MKIVYALIACALPLLTSGCARQRGNTADVQAIRAASAAWDKAWNAGDSDKLSSLYIDDAIAMGPNVPASVGKDAIRASCKKYFAQFREENHSRVEDVRISGNLAVARGTQETKTFPKAGGNSVEDRAKWISVYQRQPDGSWKILWEMYNSDLPQPASSP